MVDKGGISSILADIRSMKLDATNNIQVIKPNNLNPINDVKTSSAPGFGDLLKSAVDSVNDQKMRASELQNAYQMGDPNVDLPQVMIEAEKSSIAFEAMTQVRNRLVRAYEDVMKMGI